MPTIIETIVTRLLEDGRTHDTIHTGGHNLAKTMSSLRSLRSIDPTVKTWQIRIINKDDNTIEATYTMPSYE